MLTVSEPNESCVVVMHATDRLTKSDIERVLPDMDRLLAAHEKLRFFIKLENVSGMDAGALWEDLKYDIRHRHQYGRIAMVGDRRWEELAAKFSNLFFSAPVRFFFEDHEDQAWEWINE